MSERHDAEIAPPFEPALVGEVLGEVMAERYRQHVKWGQQDHPDGTGDAWAFCSGQHAGWADEAADDARRRCQEAPTRVWGPTYALILNEEVAEAFAEEDPARLRAELIQVAAVAVAWVEAIDRRTTPAQDPCACGSPGTYSLNPAEVVTHTADACWITPAERGAEGGE